MSVALGVLGILVLFINFYDICWTTLSSTASGPLTGYWPRIFKRFTLFLHFKLHQHYILQVTGIATVVATVILWYVLLWIGCALLFSWDPHSLMDADGNYPTAIDYIGYAGNTIFTLGSSQFSPATGIWQFMTSAMGGFGFFIVSLTAAYLINTSSAVGNLKELALNVTSIGGTPTRILVNSWTGDDFSTLSNVIDSLTTSLISIAQSHLVYPVIINFHSSDVATSGPARIAAFDELITVIELGLKDQHKFDKLTMIRARHAVSEYLDTMVNIHVAPVDSPPPLIDLARLRSLSVPVHDDPEEFYKAVREDEALQFRRRVLHGLVRSHGWEWEDVMELSTETEAAFDAMERQEAPGQQGGATGAGSRQRMKVTHHSKSRWSHEQHSPLVRSVRALPRRIWRICGSDSGEGSESESSNARIPMQSVNVHEPSVH